VLTWDRDGALLLAGGDHGFNGTTEAALAQETGNDYGKVLRLDLRGGRRVLSIGHRSPQGLLVDRQGRRWSTEHGPQGGDELNLLREGANYGWPLVSYGTQYGVAYWPLAVGKRDHGEFEEPAQAFVPSVAIAGIIQVGHQQFPDWDGDLLAASLRAMTLYRIRERAGRVAYVEAIHIGRRIRDLIEADDGRIVLWTDEGDLVTVAVAGGRPDGRRIYGRCSGCHGENLEGTGLGPPLRDVFNNRVASRPDFAYSPALRQLGGLWTRPRLHDFLADPNRFAPGNRMNFGGLPDRAERLELIEYLRRQR
jgi:cytochrome c2